MPAVATPAIEGGVIRGAGLDADASAIGTAEIDGKIDQLLQQGFGLLEEGPGEPLHALHLNDGVADVDLPIGESRGPVKVLRPRCRSDSPSRIQSPGIAG